MLTVEEVAPKLRMSPYTVRRKASKGLLRASKPGRQWLFHPDDVDAFLAQSTNTGPAAEPTTRRRRRRA